MSRLTRVLGPLFVMALVAAACADDRDEAPGDPGDGAADIDADPDIEPDEVAAPEPQPEPEPEPEPSVPADPLLVETSLGPVRGAAGETGINRWSAIPFAAPPLGENRWVAPRPHAGWTEEFDATGEGLMCPQPGGDVTSEFLVSPGQNEDCLTLTVWAPDGAADLPTMVWIHGGGLTSGSAHQALYESTDLAAQGVVVVAINYRLGTLGFLAHPDAPDGAANFGLMDQQAALRWVQDNIEGFGGDPGNVTLFGESAGGFSICGHLASDGSEGLFQRAIIQSGGGCLTHQDLNDAYADGAAFIATTSCAGAADELGCLRDLPVEELAVANSPSNLVADGVVLGEPAIDRAAAGRLNDISIITGSNQDEFTLFTIGAAEPSEDDLRATVASRFGPDAVDNIMGLYPAADYETNLARLQAMLNDVTFTCTAETFAQTVADAGGSAHRYYFSYVSDQDPFGLGATHGAELIFVFDNPSGIVGLPPELDPVGAGLSAEMQRAWTTFAATGVPESPTPWRPTGADAPVIMQIDTDWTPQTEIRGGRCGPVVEALTAS